MIPKDPFKNPETTKSPDLSFLEKVEGTVSDQIPSEELTQEATNPEALDQKVNPVTFDDQQGTEEDFEMYASIFPKKIPKPKNKKTLTDKT